MKTFSLLILFALQFKFSSSQSKIYIVEGHIKNVDTGKIYLVPVVTEDKYYGKDYKIDSSFISNGSFVFERKVFDDNIYPYRFLIRSVNKNGATDFAFLNTENQKVEVDTIDIHIAPKILNSHIQNEMRNDYNSFFKRLVEKTKKFYDYEDSLYEEYGNKLSKIKTLEIEYTQEKLLQESDSLFKSYAIDHADSQVTLWKMIERLKNLGYNSEFEIIFERLPDNLKNTTVGKHFLQNLKQSEVLKIGYKFPQIKLKNKIGNFETIDKNIFGKEYTLIDFWFVACSPCRKQFPEFVRLHNKYKNSGFEIVGISVDNQSKFSSWKNLIETDNLTWLQLIDIGGIITNKIGINSYPTNFLLDNNGVILKKNISISDLEILLVNNDLKNMINKIEFLEPD